MNIIQQVESLEQQASYCRWQIAHAPSETWRAEFKTKLEQTDAEINQLREKFNRQHNALLERRSHT